MNGTPAPCLASLSAIIGRRITRVLGLAAPESNLYRVLIEVEGREFIELYASSPIFVAKNIQEMPLAEAFRANSLSQVRFDTGPPSSTCTPEAHGQ